MYARFHRVIVVIGAIALVLTSSASVGAASPAPVVGGPSGQGVCAAQARAARSNGTVAALRAFGNCEIARRQATLTTLAAAVRGSKVLTASDRSALASMIAADSSGLATLKTAISGTVSLPTLKLEIVAIASKYRVYLLLGPQVYLTNAADGVLALQPALSGLAADLARRIAAAQASGADVTAAQAALDAMNSETAAAMSLASPVPGMLLPLTAADWNGGTAGPVIVRARSALVAAGADLRSAVSHARAALAGLE
ncbi:MAG: hypothetical protein ABSA21_02285 [Candidatus Limnocylindrales bacterium]|jgi:hypothetical protein